MALYHPGLDAVVGTQAKCGSTSLERLLERCGWQYRLPKHLPPAPDTARRRYMQVRDPWSRFCSIYRWSVKRAPHEALSHLVHDPDLFTEEFVRRWRSGKWLTFSATQCEYAERFQPTAFARLEDGGLPPVLNRELGLDLPPLPELNVNRTHVTDPVLSERALDMLRPWLELDRRRFGYGD